MCIVFIELHLIHCVEVCFYVIFVGTHLFFPFSDYRLMFWLSNSVVLRTIISQGTGNTELPLSSGSGRKWNGGGKVENKESSQLKWKGSSPGRKENAKALYGSLGNWEDPHMFVSALEKIEGWIFSRIVESIWWQVSPQFFLSFIYNFGTPWKCIVATLGYGASTFSLSSLN